MSRTIRVGNPITVSDNQGDTWVAAWSEDGSLYSPSNDTYGFHSFCDSNIAFNRLKGDDPLSLTGETVNAMGDYGASTHALADGCTWKSTGCASIDGVLYWAISRHTYGETSGDPFRRQTAKNGSIIKSTDGGRTWTRSASENYEHPMFPGSRFATPYFIQYGRGEQSSVDSADRYVYAVSNNGFWDNGDSIVLGRVPRKKVGDLNPVDWRFYIGGDGTQDANWGSNMANARPIIDSPGHLGMSGAVYVAPMKRYLMVGWYYPKGGGKMPGANKETVWDFYESPKPWGPWTKIASHRWYPQGYYCPTACLKFTAKHGQRLFVVTAGDWTNYSVYRLTLVPIDLE